MKSNNLGPKSAFLANHQEADAFMEIVSAPAFRAAVQTAFAEYVISLDGLDPRNAYLSTGAKGVLNVLLNLGNPSNPMPALQSEQLEIV